VKELLKLTPIQRAQKATSCALSLTARFNFRSLKSTSAPAGPSASGELPAALRGFSDGSLAAPPRPPKELLTDHEVGAADLEREVSGDVAHQHIAHLKILIAERNQVIPINDQ